MLGLRGIVAWDWSALPLTSIDVPPIVDTDDPHNELLVLDGAHDAVVADPNAIALKRRKLLTPRRPEIVSKRADPLHDARTVTSGDRIEVRQYRAL
jgi:hypothetical protein